MAVSCAVCGWRLVAVGGWWELAVGGWRSLGAVLKGGPYQKKIWFLKDRPVLLALGFTANQYQPPPTAANHRQPPPTTTNPQLPTANCDHHQPCLNTRSDCGLFWENCAMEHFFFFTAKNCPAVVSLVA